MARHSLRITILLGALVTLIGGTLATPKPVSATTIDLSSCSGTPFDVLALWSAILEANDETTHPGPDEIRLAPGCTYVLTTEFTGTQFALPPISSAVTIVGRAATLSVDASRPCVCNAFGLFDVTSGGDLIISDVTLRNRVGVDKGSIFSNSGTVLAVDVLIDGQGGGMYGSAIVNRSSGAFTLLESQIVDMVSSDTSRGGAIHNAGTMYVIDTEIRDVNTTQTQTTTALPAGTPRSVSNTGLLEITGSLIGLTGPTVQGRTKWGAGLDNEGVLILRDSLVHNHRTAIAGAGLHNSGTLQVDSSTFKFNGAIGPSGRGGALLNNGNASIHNSTFIGNSADQEGDAIRNAFLMTITQSTFGPTDTISNSILVPMTVGGSILPTCIGGSIDAGHNLRWGTGCPGFLGDPKLIHRDRPGLEPDVLALGPGSDAIDAGGTDCSATDQRGLARPAGVACDIGAYENQAPAPPTGFILAQGSNPSNTGDLGFDWAASDADGDVLTYRLEAADADDSGWTQRYAGTVSAATFASLAEGTYALRVAASDGNATSGYASVSGIVVDRGAPSAPTATTDRGFDYNAGDGTGWYADTVDVSFSGSTDPLLVDGSGSSGVASITPTQTIDSSGQHVVTGSATDAAGNSSPSATLTLNVDADAPAIAFDTCPASVLLGSHWVLDWTASDPESGLATASNGQVAIDTATIGPRTLSVAATDNVGHVSTATCTTAVVYDFKGYFSPIGNAPRINKASAGMVVPISFSLGGAQGLSIFAAGFPASAPIACDSAAALTTGQPTIGAQATLVYGGGRYSYQWKTEKAWAGTCRQFIIRLTDGTYHQANFAFR